MLSLAATAFVVIYLLVPNFLFRKVFTFFVPLKEYQRSTFEELAFGLLVLIFPFAIAAFVAWLFFPILTTDLQTFVSGLHSDKFFEDHNKAFWTAGDTVVYHTFKFAVIYYPSVVAEAALLGFMTGNYASLTTSLGGRKRSIYQWFARKFLFRTVSEWRILFTPSLDPKAKKVWLHVFTSDGKLYQGLLADFFLDAQGNLTGFLLTLAQRYQREQLEEDRKNGKAKAKDKYWASVDGHRLYFPFDVVSNLNITHQTEEKFQKQVQAQINGKLEARLRELAPGKTISIQNK